ncbi:HERV-H LTR-associating protein 2 [Eumetopias jubatus]|uniref:HERV-H LTR-associating protein 2 n=1 Tax=Eumetopias jubatus TaxID=34886 RepID=UPI001016A3C9|nr:HERV-H LTR-associating protein 2 [Eumetopias jubatus]
MEVSFTLSNITSMTSTRHEGTGGAVHHPHSCTISKWISRRLSLLDEGIYVCYVGTTSRKIINKVVLKVGAFVTPVMKYEKRNTDSFLICSVLSYPHPLITWKTDNASISESNMEEIESLGPFYVDSMINITGSNLSYECAIENSLLKQTWTGGGTVKDDLHKMQSENFSLSCELTNSIFLLDQDFKVAWSKVEKETSSILAYFLSSSRNTTIYGPRVSWNKERINQTDFSLTLKDLILSDSGEYLCNISSSKYTFLTIQALHVVERSSVHTERANMTNAEESKVFIVNCEVLTSL